MSDFLFVGAISSIVAKIEMAKKNPFANIKNVHLIRKMFGLLI
jgi:hypothetical protein